METIHMTSEVVQTSEIMRGTVVETTVDYMTVDVPGATPPLRECVLLDNGGAVLKLRAGEHVLVLVDSAPPYQGVVLGRIIKPVADRRAEESRSQTPDELVIEAKKNLTLKCGEGSITIREDGKILIKGKDLVSHAQRINRIKGGSVSIN